LGGVITDSIGLIHTPWIGAVMVLGAVVLTAWSIALERKDKKMTANSTCDSKTVFSS
jgi:MFS transporter, DHA1 family, inner membrane transport protein